MWTSAVGVYESIPNWPGINEFYVKEINVLQCQGTWTAHIKFAGAVLALAFWNAAAPQPREIIRKTLTGGYKCGFYLDTEWGSPLDLIWKDGTGTEVLAQLTRPIVTGLFYFWLADTAWTFMGGVESIIYRGALCNDEKPNECTLADGQGIFIALTGVCTGYSTLWDPNHWYTSPGGYITPDSGFLYEAHAYGFVLGNQTSTVHIEMAFSDVWTTGGKVLVSLDVAPGDVLSWHMTYQTPNDGTFHGYPAVTCKVTGHFEPLEHLEVNVVVFTCTAWPPSDGKPDKPTVCWNPGSAARGYFDP